MNKKPDAVTKWVASAIIGTVAVWAVKQTLGTDKGLMVGLAVMLAHQALDAPLAQFLAGEGI